MKKTILWILPILAILVLASCGMFEQRETGSVFIGIDAVYAKSILPPVDLAIDHYILTGAGPDSATWGPENVSGSLLIEDLTPGSWTFTAVGRNSGGIAIGEGSDTAEVIVGQEGAMAITVSEYTGNASLLSNLAWQPDIVGSPEWIGYVKDFAAVQTDMVFTVDELACTATSLLDPLHEGWYTGIWLLYDDPSGTMTDPVLVSGRAECIRLAAGFQTLAALWFHAVGYGGGLNIVITPDMHDELILAGTPDFSDTSSLGLPPQDESTWVQMYIDDVFNFEATAGEAVTTAYYWQGELLALDPVAGVDIDHSALVLDEHYVLDVLCFSIDGRRAGSESWIIKANDAPSVPPEANMISMSYTKSGGNNYFYVWDASVGTPLKSNAVATVISPSTDPLGTTTLTTGTLPDGTYKICMQFSDNVPVEKPYEFWQESGSYSTATIITLPEVDPDIVYAFGTLDFTP